MDAENELDRYIDQMAERGVAEFRRAGGDVLAMDEGFLRRAIAGMSDLLLDLYFAIREAYPDRQDIPPPLREPVITLGMWVTATIRTHDLIENESIADRLIERAGLSATETDQ